MQKLHFYRKALVFLVAAIGFSPILNAQSAKSLIKEGNTSMKDGQYEAAILKFTQAIALDDKRVDAYVYRAEAYYHTNRFPEAAQDYKRASDLELDNTLYAQNAGILFYNTGRFEEAVFYLNRVIKYSKKFTVAYIYKINALLALGNYREAKLTSELAIASKKSAENYYYHAYISELSGNLPAAESDYRKSIKLDKNYRKSYLGLASVLNKSGKSDEALQYCDKVLSFDTTYMIAYLVRSEIHHTKSDLISAIQDLSRAIVLSPKTDSLYFKRGMYYAEYKKHADAAADFSRVIELNEKHYMAFYKRALSYEELSMPAEATADYRQFIKISELFAGTGEFRTNAKNRIYELNKETDKPTVAISSPVLKSGSIEVPINQKSVILYATISDKNEIETIAVNNNEVKFDKGKTEIEIIEELHVENIDRFLITATDIYHNTLTQTFTIVRTEIAPPVIRIITPYTSSYKEIFLAEEKAEVFIEGEIKDESLIRSIFVEGVEAKFVSEKANPHFTATVNIEGKSEISISATDIYGNISDDVFKINRENARILANNPMGKTWVVFIDNSDYDNFASLEGPSMDISTMRSAFSKYEIHNIIEKKNMTKKQMEKFFSIELRDYVRDQQVNSLLVWYAGHGKFINQTGYWIPVDAERDDEFSYFNVNALKAYMQSYSQFITHTLVITDACESGPSFYAAMRGAKDRDCGDYSSTKFKSSQVFASAGYELAADNSPFTKTFAKSLNYNNDNCIAIDNIVTKVTEAVKLNGKQSPKFGKINGLEDEDGTFFFIKK